MTVVSVAVGFHLRLNFQLLKGALKKKLNDLVLIFFSNKV